MDEWQLSGQTLRHAAETGFKRRQVAVWMPIDVAVSVNPKILALIFQHHKTMRY
jgi:hypothetical protein